MDTMNAFLLPEKLTTTSFRSSAPGFPFLLQLLPNIFLERTISNQRVAHSTQILENMYAKENLKQISRG